MAMQLPSAPDPFDYCAFVHDTVPSNELLHVFGDMDIPGDAYFENAIARAMRADRDLVIDFTGCTYMGAAGVSVLVRAHVRFGDRIRIVAPRGGSIARLLTITHMQSILNISHSLDVALKHGDDFSNVTNIDGSKYVATQ